MRGVETGLETSQVEPERLPHGTASNDAKTLLDLRGIHKSYGDVPVVKDVHLQVAEGEFVTLLGPSGSGKTTILNIVAGFVAPSSGQIDLEGKSIIDVPPHRRNLGVVFQNYALFPHMSAFENVAFPLKMRRLRKQELKERVAEALRLVNLEDRGSAMASELSGGQQQRIALARALVYSPRMLLMDEPMAALDKRLRDRLQEEVRRLQQRLGITVLYVTHDQQEAFLLSDRIAVMNDGKLVQVGTGQDLYQRPRSMFVANFVGESNTFRGSVSARDRVFCVTGSSLRIPVTSEQVSRFATLGEVQTGLMVRPEQITMTGVPPTDGPDLPGVISSCRFVGDAMKYTVNISGLEREVVCRRSAGAEGLDVGQAVHVSWQPDHSVLVLEDE